jgi:glycine/D-amino acid oxidase-like deaminating enzyme
MYDYIVVGTGLIGSAALRYLSKVSANVAAIGPEEPPSYEDHTGVFASHYGQASITRIVDSDIVWATLAKRSIARYREIERDSNIRFFSDVGCLKVAPASGVTDDYIIANERIAIKLGADYQLLDHSDLKNTFPFFNFPDGYVGIMEHSTAGYINPRALISAELNLAQKKGAHVLRETVVRVLSKGSYVEVETDKGMKHKGKKVLITAGAFTNCYQLLEKKLSLDPIAETVLLARLSDSDVSRLSMMPSVIYLMKERPNANKDTYVYMVPPILYPDGQHYLKVGGDFEMDCVKHTLLELQAWFQSEGSSSIGEKYKDVLASIMPDIKPLSYATKPCVIALTQSGWPYIDSIVKSQVYVATGGCGTGAKSSDEIGRLAAALIEKDVWHDQLPHTYFKCSYLNDTASDTGQLSMVSPNKHRI